MIPEGFDPSKPGVQVRRQDAAGQPCVVSCRTEHGWLIRMYCPVQMVVPRSTRGGISKRPASAIADEGLVNSRMRRGVTLTRHRDLNNIELEASQSRPWGSDRSPAASQAQPSSGAQSALVDSGGAADMLERQQRMQDLSTLKVGAAFPATADDTSWMAFLPTLCPACFELVLSVAAAGLPVGGEGS